MSQLGQKAKYSSGADVFRFTPESGLKSDIAPCPFRAMNGLVHRRKNLINRSPHRRIGHDLQAQRLQSVVRVAPRSKAVRPTYLYAKARKVNF
jgi:hypothetical protein